VNEASWIRARGGLAEGICNQRAQFVSLILGGCTDVPTRVCVLNSDSIGAYSWPDGKIFVTRGLVQRLTDEELLAAIAHEMGHLVNDGHLRTIASLQGCTVSLDAESRADSTGAALLTSRGVSSIAMIAMLQKVRNSPALDPVCREALGHRIEFLAAREKAKRAAGVN
jgi:predicted Zn-dependent protease